VCHRKKLDKKTKKKFFAKGHTVALGKEFRNLNIKLFAEGYRKALGKEWSRGTR
jgi:hypothetical protein